MKSPIQTTALVALAALSAVLPNLSFAQDASGTLLFDQAVDRDLYAAKREIRVLAPVGGDFVAAGQHVTIDGRIDGDVTVAAQEIEIRAAVSDDVRAAGQHLRVTAPIAGHVVAAAQTITLQNSVGGWASLAGTSVDVLGPIGGDLKVRANAITLNTAVDGDVELTAAEVRVGPDADVRGNLIWHSDKPVEISPEANIEGELIERPAPGLGEQARSGRTLLFTFSVIIAVMALFLLFARPMRASADRIGAHPGLSMSLGFALLVATPVLALILVFSPLSAWVGLGVLAGYLVLLLVGVLTGLFAISDLALRRFRPRPAAWQALAAIVLVVIGVGLLGNVPYLGALAVLVIWLLGIGAVGWGGWLSLRDNGKANAS